MYTRRVSQFSRPQTKLQKDNISPSPPRGQTHPWPDTSRANALPPLGRHPLPETAIAANAMHHSWMHSCFFESFLLSNIKIM